MPGDKRAIAKKAIMRGANPLPAFITVGVIWFRQATNVAEITGMIPPYGSKQRTDEDNIYGELQAA